MSERGVTLLARLALLALAGLRALFLWLHSP